MRNIFVSFSLLSLGLVIRPYFSFWEGDFFFV